MIRKSTIAAINSQWQCEEMREDIVQRYLVGGAVRDQLLNIAVYDRDWVVVGATPEQLAKQGFTAVGKDFPVFFFTHKLKKNTLSRVPSVKTGSGYTGFECYFAADVTLEEDLMRRDLTINAMAQDDTGHIVDPYQGQQDLHDRILRHVSDAFC
ncbi:hypothetical protein QW180_12865 [Vibrio sinaloensis]|nr:hypothetical protein [Vibrio sinaloensis]